jgi:hypothetical protein
MPPAVILLSSSFLQKNAFLIIASSMAARPRTACALAESTRLPQRFDVCVTAGKKLLE